MVYFTSDLHFGHKNVISMCNRPFETVDQMNETLIKNWNSVVSEMDEIYILGDITLHRSWNHIAKYLRDLNGKKSLIKGNHDKWLYDKKCDRSYFDIIVPYHELDIEGRKLVLCHYPIADWNGKYRGSIHLHGHVHSTHWSALQVSIGRVYDVGVDANNYFPVSLDQIFERCDSIDSLGIISQHINKSKGETEMDVKL